MATIRPPFWTARRRRASPRRRPAAAGRCRAGRGGARSGALGRTAPTPTRAAGRMRGPGGAGPEGGAPSRRKGRPRRAPAAWSACKPTGRMPVARARPHRSAAQGVVEGNARRRPSAAPPGPCPDVARESHAGTKHRAAPVRGSRDEVDERNLVQRAAARLTVARPPETPCAPPAPVGDGASGSAPPSPSPSAKSPGRPSRERKRPRPSPDALGARRRLLREWRDPWNAGPAPPPQGRDPPLAAPCPPRAQG